VHPSKTPGAPDGALAVIGGTDVFGLFLEIGYDSFHLSRAKNLWRAFSGTCWRVHE
jgi:hypothetical protein